jgi:hypothetical protein
MRLKLVPLLIVSSLALVACGDDSDSAAPVSAGTIAAEESKATAAAAAEAHETKEAVEAAVEAYRSGDALKAEEQVAEAYVSHFEHVEDALREKDAELNESLEERISGDLREAIRAKDDAKVDALSASILADLEKAEALLGGSARAGTPLAEAAATADAIKEAIATYRAGDAATAEDQVAEAYVSHFEHVEDALREKAAELNETLEERISGDLREAIKAGDDAKVDALSASILADLEKARTALR